jgi:hypothetical protein
MNGAQYEAPFVQCQRCRTNRKLPGSKKLKMNGAQYEAPFVQYNAKVIINTVPGRVQT